MTLMRSQRLFSDPFYLQGIFFFLYCCILLVSFCAYAVAAPVWLRASNVLFFLYFIIAWMFIDPVLIWTFAVSTIIYYLFIPGVSLVAGVFLFAMTLVLTYLYDMRRRTLSIFEERAVRLRRGIHNLLLRIDSHNVQIERINRKIQQVGYFKQMTETISGKLDESRICEHIVSFCGQIITRGDAIRLFLLEPNLQRLALHRQLLCAGTPAGDIEYDALNRLVLRNNRSIRITDTAADGRIEAPPEIIRHVRSTIAAPLITADRVLGVIRIDSGKPGTFSLSDQRFLSDIANFAALLLSNARLYALTRQLAVTDGLTGMATHNACLQEINSLIGSHRNFSLLFADIDDFKPVNDTFGHIIGDQALIHISQIIAQTAPAQTFVSRYGGEEFVVVLEQTPLPEAADAARKICRAVAESTFSVRRTPLTLTVSIGVASYDSLEAVSGEDIIRAADLALYRAKQEGKNRVVVDDGFYRH